MIVVLTKAFSQKCQLTFRIFDKERAFETFSSALYGDLSSPQIYNQLLDLTFYDS